MAVICYTADTHSYMYPTDYITPAKLPMGYISLSSAFDKDAIIIDGGDVLQGSPLVRYEIKNKIRPFFSSLCYRAAGIDVYVPGNHDFNFGYDVLKDFISGLGCDFVCANLTDLKGELDVRPYVLKTAGDGVRVFISGVVTDYVNVWEDERNLRYLRVTDSVKAAKEALSKARSLGADYTVLVYHGGFGAESFQHPPIMENRGDELSMLGYDVLLQAHQHSVVEPRVINGTLTMQVGAKAFKGARIELEPGGGAVHARLFDADPSVPLLPDMERVVENDFVSAGVKRYLSQVVGRTDGVFMDKGKLESAMSGCELADFINDVQLSLSKADVSVASLPNDAVSIGPEVTMADLLALYPFSNTVVMFKMTAAELREAMERSASYFSLDGEGKVCISESFIKPKVEHYNYDYYRGLSYAFDISRPVGNRVVRMAFKDHDLLKDGGFVLNVCVNSYRASGTGGYDIYGRLVPVKRFGEDVQDLVINEFEKGNVVARPVKTDFRILPENGR